MGFITVSQEISNSKLYVLLVLVSIAIVTSAAGLYAARTGSSLQKEEHTLSVSGSASAFAVPDRASMNIGVLTQARTAKEESEKNAASMTSVLNEIKNLGVPDKDIRTSILSIQPVYDYPKEGGAPTITGYSASNSVVVTTDVLEKLGDIVDMSVAAGANQVSGISFEVSEEKQKQIQGELLVSAVKDAEGKANKLAENLKVRISGVK